MYVCMYIMYYNIGLVRSTQIAPRVGDQNRASVSHGVYLLPHPHLPSLIKWQVVFNKRLISLLMQYRTIVWYNLIWYYMICTLCWAILCAMLSYAIYLWPSCCRFLCRCCRWSIWSVHCARALPHWSRPVKAWSVRTPTQYDSTRNPSKYRKYIDMIM